MGKFKTTFVHSFRIRIELVDPTCSDFEDLISSYWKFLILSSTLPGRAIVNCLASLVGKLLTKRGFSRATLKDTMRKVWGSPEGLQVVGVGDNLFHFRFSNEMDLQRVVNGVPGVLIIWCYYSIGGKLV